MRRVVAYIRVSSKTQSHALQELEIAREAARRGHDIGEWYADKTTGGSLARPGLARLRLDVSAGRIERLYVYRLDRLTRSGVLDTMRLVQELRARGVELVTVSDGFDLAGPAADAMLALMAWCANMELRARGERIAAARAAMEASGRSWGRPPAMTACQVQRAMELRQLGHTLRGIAIKLKVPKSTLGRALRVVPKTAPGLPPSTLDGE